MNINLDTAVSRIRAAAAQQVDLVLSGKSYDASLLVDAAGNIAHRKSMTIVHCAKRLRWTSSTIIQKLLAYPFGRQKLLLIIMLPTTL